MNSDKLIKSIKAELVSLIDEEYRVGCEKYYTSADKKERSLELGVRTPLVRKISAKHFKSVKNCTKNEIFQIAEMLLKQEFSEYSVIAFDWIFRKRKEFISSDIDFFEKMITNYVHDWGRCDDLCTHSLGFFLINHPEHIVKVYKWAKSKNRWFRRASAVALIVPLRNGIYANESIKVAEILLNDKEDLVQKGYGWMLKEAAEKNFEIVFSFLMKNKSVMPRTALRYAIEKFPDKEKREVMKK